MSPLNRGIVPGRVSAVMAGTRAGRAHREGQGGPAARRGRAPGRGRNLILPAALLAALGVLAGCGTAAKPVARPTPTFGAYPSYLPKDTLNHGSDAALTGTIQRPALTNEGDAVKVKTSQWSVLVTVSGPQVPGEGLPYQATETTCTWVVTMSGATGTVPISPSDFSSIDQDNDVYHPVLVPGQPKPPKVLHPGEKASFELRVVEATGEGLMRWAPNGRNIVAKWDFVVEND
jgi:hypothetical protein